MTSHEQIKHALAYAVEPAINKMDAEALKVITDFGIDLKNSDYLTNIVYKFPLKFLYYDAHGYANPQPDHKKYIKMINCLLDAGCKLPVLGSRHFYFGLVWKNVILVVEFLLNQGAEVEDSLLSLRKHIVVCEFLGIRIFQLILHNVNHTDKKNVINAVFMGFQAYARTKLLIYADCPFEPVELKIFYARLCKTHESWRFFVIENMPIVDLLIEAI